MGARNICASAGKIGRCSSHLPDATATATRPSNKLRIQNEPAHARQIRVRIQAFPQQLPGAKVCQNATLGYVSAIETVNIRDLMRRVRVDTCQFREIRCAIFWQERQRSTLCRADFQDQSGCVMVSNSKILAVFSLTLGALAAHAPPLSAQTLSIGDYARRCEKLISDVPAFSCSQGTEIKMRVTGKNSDGQTQCDNHGVQSGGLACEPGSRLVRLTPQKNAQDTDIMFLCRANRRSRGGYFQVAGLHYNKRTGTTCWYHSLGHGFTSGENMVSPTSDAPGEETGGIVRRTLAEETWDKVTRSGPAGDNCSICHAADPYLLTPFVASVNDKNALPGLEKTRYRQTGTTPPILV